MPSLQPAVFPPSLKELPGPNLELFDLDEQFASEKKKLAQLTNKCTDNELDYYITDACNILGLGNDVADRANPKAVLYHIFNKLVRQPGSHSLGCVEEHQQLRPLLSCSFFLIHYYFQAD